jgi:hypothetical protein
MTRLASCRNDTRDYDAAVKTLFALAVVLPVGAHADGFVKAVTVDARLS